MENFEKEQLFSRIRNHFIIFTLWFNGLYFSYYFYVNLDKHVQAHKVQDYIIIMNGLCLFVVLVSAGLFYFLINKSCEKHLLARNIRASKYISMGLDRLNERFVLIDVLNERYEFLYTTRENDNAMKTGPYCEFVDFLRSIAVQESDKEKLSEILPLKSLLEHLTPDKTNYSIPIQFRINGENYWDLLSFIVIERDEDQIHKILLSRRDITETQTKEVEQQRLLTDALAQAENANKAKTTFLFNMSHDIRTPMNAIIGFTTMAKKYLDTPEIAKDYLNKVDMSSQHMLHIVNDILDMARIDSGKVELESAPINIYKECHATDALFRSSMEEREIEFSIDIHIMDDIVLGDAMRIKQIVVNLVSNAMKYTKPGGKVELHYKQTKHSEDGFAYFEISVRDTGIGMSEEYQRHLFEAFERERSATVSGIQGTGLGLAISKQLTDLMGGSLTCKSKLGVGTEFLLKLKLPIAGYTANTKKEIIDTTAFSGKHILLVEDNDLNREIAVDMLEEMGFVVDEASDGSIAVEKVSQMEPGYYQMILMDIQMPYMDGYYATHTIRMLPNEQISSTPIIAMTANAFAEDREKALQAGMNAHLSKPINAKELIETLYVFI